MDWTLADIKSKVRNLTGRQSTAALSDADLENHINQYYQNVFPDELGLIRELQAEFSISLTDSDDGQYGLPESILAITGNASITDSDDEVWPLNIYSDRTEFFDVYPRSLETEDDRNQPTGLLIWGRGIYVRPLPDAAYTLKFDGNKRPSALTADALSPLSVKWGPIIAYGASIEILQEAGENDEADGLKDLYEHHILSINRRNLNQIPLGTRAVPRF